MYIPRDRPKMKDQWRKKEKEGTSLEPKGRGGEASTARIDPQERQGRSKVGRRTTDGLYPKKVREEKDQEQDKLASWTIQRGRYRQSRRG